MHSRYILFETYLSDFACGKKSPCDYLDTKFQPILCRHGYLCLTKVTKQHVIVVCCILWWFECICHYQPNPYSLLYLWPSIRLLMSSMTLQQKISSSVPWKPQEGFINLQLNMASNHQLCQTSGPNTKTQVQPKTSHVLGHQSFQIVGNGW